MRGVKKKCRTFGETVCFRRYSGFLPISFFWGSFSGFLLFSPFLLFLLPCFLRNFHEILLAETCTFPLQTQQLTPFWAWGPVFNAVPQVE